MNAFADKIKPALGIKFNLAWTYGDYLNYVPSRLGKNEALDAATDTFIAAIGVSISDPGADHTPMLLEKYGHSLASLRRCLDDPVKAKAPETLAAILFLWNCQVGPLIPFHLAMITRLTISKAVYNAAGFSYVRTLTRCGTDHQIAGLCREI